MRISSFYGDAFDGQFSLRLKESARSFGIACDVSRWSKDASEADKARLRTRLLTDALLQYPDEDVLFVEPDAQFHRRPDVLLDEKDFDVGVYYDSETLDLSGPIFLRNNAWVLEMVREWDALNQAVPDSSELENLSRVLSRPRSPLEVRRLPITYAWVERIHRESYPRAQPVIVHFKTDGLLSSHIRLRR
jgi:hypothetical protein